MELLNFYKCFNFIKINNESSKELFKIKQIELILDFYYYMF